MLEKFAHLFPEGESEMIEMSQHQRHHEAMLAAGEPTTLIETGSVNSKQQLSSVDEWEMVEEAELEERAVNGLQRAKVPSSVILDYIYHLNARTPATGEQAFRYESARALTTLTR